MSYQTHTFNKNDVLTADDMNNIISGIDELRSSNTTLLPSKIYVSAINGNDSNDGSSWSKAKKTFANALANSSDDCVVFFEGDTNERLNILTKPTQKSLKIIGREDTRNRLLGGTKVTDFTADSTSNVYYAKLSANNPNLSQSRFRIYQHDLNDTTTLISNEEKHPAQKGRAYRCTSTKLTRVGSVSAVRSSSTFCYYFDTSSLTLYIRTTTKPSATNPIYIPTDVGSVYGNDGSCCVEFSNIETWYAPFLITKCPIANVIDCASHYALGTGCLRYDDSVSVRLVRFEANSTQNNSGYGDGINGHSTTLDANLGTNLLKPVRYSLELVDCWSHDNMDDGWSDHTGAVSVVRGGLYEYNTKGGITPSGGARSSCYHVLSRKNYRGFYYICSTSTSKETTAWWYCQDCISMNNSIAGFDTESNGSSLPIHALLNKCQSINDVTAYRIGKYSYVKAIDCSAYGASALTTKESSALGFDIIQTTLLGESGGSSGGSSTSNSITWQQGALTGNGESANDKRIRTSMIDLTNVTSLTTGFDTSLYNIAVYWYDSISSTTSTNTASWEATNVNIDADNKISNYVRLVFKKINEETITPNEANLVGLNVTYNIA